MLVGLVVLVALVVFVILEIVGENLESDLLQMIGCFGSLISLFALVALGCCIKTKRSVECDINEYNEIKRAIEQTNGEGLEEKVLEFNKKIDENRVNATSRWIGWYYSEEVGNLQKIDYKKK